MATGPIPIASIYGTWSENVEIWSVDDDTLMDLTSLVEATLTLRDPRTGFAELTVTMSNGGITIPSTGILQWRVEQNVMGAMSPRMYDMTLVLEDESDVVPLILGSVSIVG